MMRVHVCAQARGCVVFELLLVLSVTTESTVGIKYSAHSECKRHTQVVIVPQARVAVLLAWVS